MEDFNEYLDKNLPIITSKYLQSLSIHNSEETDPSCVNLCELLLIWRMDKLSEYHHFSSSVALQEDPMPTLGKLPNLRLLILDEHAFMGKKMVCSAPHFPQLESLILDRFWYLEEWEVEEGAMPALRNTEDASGWIEIHYNPPRIED
ncbi:hypothetical protein V6N13_085645 [Hibiscus sabdariffa]